ncbi:MAG TPA: glycosyltransferase family 39 protein [Anaerolineae bacterium]|nr:glycosyltransferase family 39 protein [Anaerolineae bacterium]
MIEKLSPSPHLDRRAHWVALGLCLLALVGYLYHLDVWRMNDDEGDFLYQVWRMSEGEMPYRDFLSSQTPVFLYAGAGVAKVFGPSSFALRAASAGLMLLTGLILYATTQRLAGPHAGLLTLAIFLLHPHVYQQGRLFMSEAYMLFFASLGLYAFAVARERGTGGWYALAGVAFALSTLSKLFGLLPLGGCLLFLGWELLTDARRRRRPLISGGIMLGAWLGVVILVFGGLSLAVPDLFDTLIGHHLRQGEQLTRLQVAGKGLKLFGDYLRRYPLFLLPALFAAVREVVRKGRGAIFAWQMPTALAFLLLSRELGQRHLMILLPSLAALFALALEPWLARRRKPALAVALVWVGLTLGPWAIADVERAQQGDTWTGPVAAYIQSHTADDDLIISDYPGLNFFAQRRGTYSCGEISHVTTTNGRITGAKLRQEIATGGVKMVLIDEGLVSGHQLTYLPDYPALRRYLRAHYQTLDVLPRAEQRLRVYWTDSPPTTTADPLHIQHPLRVELGETVRLVGYDLPTTTVRAGEVLPLTLYWAADRPTSIRWSVFVHLLDGEGQLWGQHDKQPQDGVYPTDRWSGGEVVDDDYAIAVPADAPPDEYRLEVGMYNWVTGERLAVFDASGGRVTGDRILLDLTITVLPNQ